jgi:hypothetical protein
LNLYDGFLWIYSLIKIDFYHMYHICLVFFSIKQGMKINLPCYNSWLFLSFLWYISRDTIKDFQQYLSGRAVCFTIYNTTMYSISLACYYYYRGLLPNTSWHYYKQTLHDHYMVYNYFCIFRFIFDEIKTFHSICLIWKIWRK